MISFNYTVKGVRELAGALNKIKKDEEKALQTAIRVEGFRLMNILKKEIKEGNPGGSRFKQLSMIAQKRNKTKKALRRLSLGIRYQAIMEPDFIYRLGWVGPKVSKSWKRLAEMHQQGFTREITDEQRRYFRIVGGQLKGRWVKSGRSGGMIMGENKFAKFFFLRKETKTLKTPGRPIMDPFWQAYRNIAFRNIEKNWKKKLAGEKI